MRQAPPGWEHAPSATCGQVGEHAFIRWIASAVGTATSPDVVLGIGDDAAVVRPRRNHVDVVTTDVQVDGVHFTRASSSPADVGHRVLHVNLSDIAAMGGEPRVALLSLGLPADLDAQWVAELVQGVIDATRAHRMHLVGGNISLFTELCEKTRNDAYEMMLRHAEQLGANAVIGIRYDATEVMSGVTEVLCYGTAVVVEPIPTRANEAVA